MLNKKILSIGGMSGVALTAVLLVFVTGLQDEVMETEELPTMLGGGFPPATKLTDTDVGNGILSNIESKTKDLNGQNIISENPEFSKYNPVKIIDGYKYMHVYKDEQGDKDIILGKIPVTPESTGHDVLYSKKYIWITVEPHDEPVAKDLYAKLPLNEGYKLVSINDDIKYAPVREMTQLVDFEGNKGVILPLDIWFVTENYSYTIRGHITEAQAIEVANIIVSIEE